jgi:phosphatidylglycerophosphatase A
MAKTSISPSVSVLTRLAWLVGTGLGAGLSPFAPATIGSLVAVVIYFFLPIPGDSIAFYLLIGFGLLVGVWATGSLITPLDHDPRQAVWDEFVGMWVTCILLPKTIPWLIIAFFCFRVLDVWKPWPGRRLERLPAGLGVMADDLLVGIYGAVLLNAVRLIFFP